MLKFMIGLNALGVACCIAAGTAQFMMGNCGHAVADAGLAALNGIFLYVNVKSYFEGN